MGPVLSDPAARAASARRAGVVGSEGCVTLATDFFTAFVAAGRGLASRVALTRAMVRVLRRAPVSGKSPGSDDMTKCFISVSCQ